MSIVVNGWWQYKHEKGNHKGKVNGPEVSDGLTKLGMVGFNVVHVVHKYGSSLNLDLILSGNCVMIIIMLMFICIHVCIYVVV